MIKMFVNTGVYKNETVKMIVDDYFCHEFSGSTEDLVNLIHEAINEEIEISEKNKDKFWTFVKDYIKADYKTFDDFYDNALSELYSDIRKCFKEVELTKEESKKFQNELNNYISCDLTYHIMKYLENKYPDMEIKTGDISFDELDYIYENVERIVNESAVIAVENMTKKEEK